MRKLFFMFFACLLVVSGCSSKTSSEQNEIEEGDSGQSESMEEEIIMETEEERSEKEKLKAAIENYQEAIKILESETDVVRNQLSLFSLEKIKKDDQLGDLVVTDMKIENINGYRNQYVAFEGVFEVEGYLQLNQGGSGWKYLFIVEEDLRNIPHSFYDLEKGKLAVTISNEDDLEASLGEKINELQGNNRLKITALFKNYNYIYAENSDLLSTVMFHALMETHDF